MGKKWVLANESPQSLNWVGAPAVEIAPVPGLSGYLLAQGALVDSVPFDATTSDTRGSMFLEIPVGFGRDTVSGQSDWKLFDRDLSPISSGGATPATLQAPAGAYLAIFGPAGTTSTVVVD